MYCVTRYGEVEFEIEKDYDKRHKRLLERYPLPKNWRKVYDIGCKAFYYYNKNNHLVSWLPPTHPDAKVGKSAKVLRKELMEQTNDLEETDDPQAYVVESYPPLAKPEEKEQRSTALLKPPIVCPPRKPSNSSKSRRDRGRDRDYDYDD
jgi:polyglutamine-binding protein 1